MENGAFVFPSKLFIAAFGMALLVSCGGGGSGGGNSSPSASPASQYAMSLDKTQISVSGQVGGAAPTADVYITVTGPVSSSTNLYMYASDTTGLVTNATITNQGNPADLNLSFQLPGALGAGTFTDTLTVGVYLDQAHTQAISGGPKNVGVTYTVAAAPVLGISSLSPTSAVAGSAGFTLTVTGTQFQPYSQVLWNGTSLATTYVSSTQLTAAVPASAITQAGLAEVTVSSAALQQGTSAPFGFTVTSPGFSIASITPVSATAGGPAFTLTVNGYLFDPSALVQWNGSPRATTYVSANQLTAQITASDIASTGTASVTVANPAQAGGTSGAASFYITGTDAVALQITSGHSGAMQFPSVTLPSAALWSVTLDGPPSYALIAQGKVYVTVSAKGLLELVALDQATGAKVWGPIALGLSGNACYDAGTVYVVYTTGFASPGMLQAFDGATGASKWSSTLPGQYALDAAPTASNGMVYATESGVGVTLYGFNGATGALVWSKLLMAGDNCDPAVTPAGVYVSYPDYAGAFDPKTGANLWQVAPGGDGGGGATPVVAGGLMFAPNGSGTYSGQVLSTSTGAVVGGYIAQNLPAIGNSAGYFLQSGTLRAIDLASNAILWSFPGDGGLCSSPIVVNDIVFIGSSSGNLYALDASSGSQLWTQKMPDAVPNGPGWASGLGLSGLSAGNGLLVVPAGNTLTAFKLD